MFRIYLTVSRLDRPRVSWVCFVWACTRLTGCLLMPMFLSTSSSTHIRPRPLTVSWTRWVMKGMVWHRVISYGTCMDCFYLHATIYIHPYILEKFSYIFWTHLNIHLHIPYIYTYVYLFTQTHHHTGIDRASEPVSAVLRADGLHRVQSHPYPYTYRDRGSDFYTYILGQAECGRSTGGHGGAHCSRGHLSDRWKKGRHGIYLSHYNYVKYIIHHIPYIIVGDAACEGEHGYHTHAPGEQAETARSGICMEVWYVFFAMLVCVDYVAYVQLLHVWLCDGTCAFAHEYAYVCSICMYSLSAYATYYPIQYSYHTFIRHRRSSQRSLRPSRRRARKMPWKILKIPRKRGQRSLVRSLLEGLRGAARKGDLAEVVKMKTKKIRPRPRESPPLVPLASPWLSRTPCSYYWARAPKLWLIGPLCSSLRPV